MSKKDCHGDIKIKRFNGGYTLTFNNFYKESINLFQRTRQLFCKHEWEEIEGQDGHWNCGYEIKTEHYRCPKCRLNKSEGKIIGTVDFHG